MQWSKWHIFRGRLRVLVRIRYHSSKNTSSWHRVGTELEVTLCWNIGEQVGFFGIKYKRAQDCINYSVTTRNRFLSLHWQFSFPHILKFKSIQTTSQFHGASQYIQYFFAKKLIYTMVWETEVSVCVCNSRTPKYAKAQPKKKKKMSIGMNRTWARRKYKRKTWLNYSA